MPKCTDRSEFPIKIVSLVSLKKIQNIKKKKTNKQLKVQSFCKKKIIIAPIQVVKLESYSKSPFISGHTTNQVENLNVQDKIEAD